MELVTCIAGKIVDYSVEPIKRQVDYVIHCKSNLEKLEIELNDLRDARRTIEERIAEDTRRGRRILEEVEKWVKEVDEVTGMANQLKDESRAANLNCVNGCSLNLRMRRQLSKQSIQLMKDIARLSHKKEFLEISSGHLIEEVGGIPTGDYMPFDSRESAVEKVMDELKNPNTVRIGLCGIGGVGKTTLAKQVFRKAKQNTSLFDIVAILFDVKSIQEDKEGIQKQIVEKLKMDLEKDETMVKRAGRLCAYINGKKILIILDDVQTKIDLEQLGVPGVATCKILLTSRIPISGMSIDKGFQLGVLPEEEAWELFAKKAVVGDKVPAIQRVAKQVAKKCGGLPVLVVTVASSLKDRKRLHSWNNALRCLKEFDHKDKSPEKEAHSTIEWSYNQLDDSMLKDLFLLCGTTVRGNRISLEDLLKYSMGLSEFKNNHTVEQTRNAFYSEVEKLKDFCLLIDEEDDTSVGMHDIVRDAARHIALRDRHMLSAVLEDGGDDQSDQNGWPNKELTEKCTTISFPSAVNIPEVLQCPALKMLLLQGDNWNVSLKILSGFEEMKHLRVLSLGHMRLPSLPSSLQFLNNLQTLCLHQCKLEDISLVGQLNNLEILSLENSIVEQLPKEIGQLTRLRLLDLSNCSALEVVSPGVISSLKRLEELRMKESFKNWKATGDGSNADLVELTHLCQLTALEVHVPDANILPADFLSHELKRFQIMIGDEWYWGYKDDRTLNRLKLKLTTTSSIELERGLKKLLKICDDLSLDGTESVNHIVRQLDSQDCPQPRHLRVNHIVQNNVDFEYIRNKSSFLNLEHLELVGMDVWSGSPPAELVLDKLKYIKFGGRASSVPHHVNEKLFPNLEIIQVMYSSCEEIFVNEGNTSCGEIHAVGSGTLPHVRQLKLYGSDVLHLGNSQSAAAAAAGPLFPNLQILHVADCYRLKNVESSTISFQNLTTLTVEFCDKLEYLTSYSVADCHRLKNVESSTISFQNLTTLTVQYCHKLEYLFTSYSVAKSLVQLTKLQVKWCKSIVAIVVGDDDAAGNEIAFSRLQHLELCHLPSLQGFCSSENCIVKCLPSVNLDVELCSIKLNISSDGVLQTKKLRQDR